MTDTEAIQRLHRSLDKRPSLPLLTLALEFVTAQGVKPGPGALRTAATVAATIQEKLDHDRAIEKMFRRSG